MFDLFTNIFASRISDRTNQNIIRVNDTLICAIEQLKKNNNISEQILKVLLSMKFRICPPGRMSVRFVQELLEENTMDTIVFDVSLPPVSVPSDVVSRELQVIVDGAQAEVKSVGKDDTVVSRISVPQDSAVRLELRNIDDSGNVSEPSVFEFTAVDTISPPAPGTLGVVIVDEIVGSPAP